ncbi:hypothetical protein BGZ70_002075 [Mortierella alpina]|uniref:Uncharacterized protein n=1 Tax=Mortierella alpina TaxID=64518 RepID=A0A9P6IV47_MORAP|nr:hypothetical protein BGZ70_002075 [Mortierella alpina]
MSRHVAYRAAVDLYHKRIQKGTEYRASGIITNSIYKISKGGKQQAGLSTRMVVDMFDMEEPEPVDDELDSIPVKVYDNEQDQGKDETVEKVIKALGKAKRVVVPPSESESDDEPLTVTPVTPQPSKALEDITNVERDKKGPGRPRKRAKSRKDVNKEQEEEQEEEQNGESSMIHLDS